MNSSQAENTIRAVNTALIKKLNLKFPERELDEIQQQIREAQATRKERLICHYWKNSRSPLSSQTPLF